MKKITTLFLALVGLMLGAVQTVSAETYPLKIGGVQVTSDNITSFKGLKINLPQGTIIVCITDDAYIYYSQGDTNPWLDFKANSTYKDLHVLLMKSDGGLDVSCENQCIKSTGPVSIATSKNGSDETKYVYMSLSSHKAPAIECTDLTLKLRKSQFKITSNDEYAVKMNGELTYACSNRYGSGIKSTYWSYIQAKRCAVDGMTKFTNSSSEYVHDMSAYKPTVANGVFFDHYGDVCAQVNFNTDSQEHLEEFRHITNLSICGKRITLYNADDVFPYESKSVRVWWDVESNALTGKHTITDMTIYYDNSRTPEDTMEVAATNEPIIKCTEDCPLNVRFTGAWRFINRKNTDASFIVAKSHVRFINQWTRQYLQMDYTGTKGAMISTPGAVTFHAGYYEMITHNQPLFDNCSKVKLADFTRIVLKNSGSVIGTSSCGTISVSENSDPDCKIWGYRPVTHEYGQATWNSSNKQFRGDGNPYMELYVMQDFRDYGIVVGGTRITSWNAYVTAIPGFHNVTYDPNVRRLSIRGGTVQSEKSDVPAIEFESSTGQYSIDGMGTPAIGKAGSSTTSCGIKLNGATLRISGKLNINNVKTGIDLGGGTLQIDGCQLGINATQYGLRGNGTGAVEVNAAAINVKGGTYSISGLREMSLNNCIISSPSNAKYDSDKKGVIVSGNLTNQSVVTAPNAQAYNLYINSTSTGQVTDVNCGDILGDGNVRFVPSSGRLVLEAGAELSSIQGQAKNSSRVTPDTIILELNGNVKIGRIGLYANQYLEIRGFGHTITMTGNLSSPGVVNVCRTHIVTTGSVTSNNKTNTLILDEESSIYAAKGIDAAAVQLDNSLGVVGGKFDANQKGFVDNNGNHAEKVLITGKKFPVYVAGIQVTTDNYDAPLGPNYGISVDPRTNTVLVNNLTYTTNACFLILEDKHEYTLKFEGKNSITSTDADVVYSSGALTICKNSQSNNTLRLTANGAEGSALNVHGPLTFISGTRSESMSDCDSVLLKGGYAGILMYGDSLIVDTRCTVIGMQGDEYTGLSGVGGIGYYGHVGNAEFQNGGLMKKGEPYKGWAWFNHSEMNFPFIVNGDTVNMYNFTDILGDGTLYILNENGGYVSTDILVMDNCHAENLNIRTTKYGPLFKVIGDNRIVSSATVFDLKNGAYIYTVEDENTGSLNIEYSGDDYAINSFGGTTSLCTHVNIEAPNGGGIWSDGGTLYIDKHMSDVPADRDSVVVRGAVYGSIVGFSEMEMEKHYIATPKNAVFVENVGIAVNGEVTKDCVRILPGENVGLQEVKNAQISRDGQKFILDGTLYIVRNGHIYNAQGTVVE